MDISTITGLGIGFGLILLAMILGGSNLSTYADFNSLLMVIGGSFAAMMISNPFARILGLSKIMKHVFRVPNYQIEKTIVTLVNFSERARREGLLALEDDIEEVRDDFLKDGIQMVVDGTDPEIIKKILFSNLEQLELRHRIGIRFFSDWGSLAPAFGMIGTLAGLIAMLANLDDPDVIGAGMSLALITTMYGSIFANMVLIPFRNKLRDRDQEEQLTREIIIEGILSIQAGDNPNILKFKLVSFLDPVTRNSIMNEMAGK